MTVSKTPSPPSQAAARAAALKQWWQGLASRERLALQLMALALLAAALWVAWLEPTLKQRAHWHEELARLQTQARQLAPMFQSRRQQQASAGAPHLATLESKLAAEGIGAATELHDDGTQWRMQVHNVPLDALWRALLPLLTQPGVALQAMTLDRTGDEENAVARVSGSIVLAVQPVGATQ